MGDGISLRAAEEAAEFGRIHHDVIVKQLISEMRVSNSGISGRWESQPEDE